MTDAYDPTPAAIQTSTRQIASKAAAMALAGDDDQRIRRFTIARIRLEHPDLTPEGEAEALWLVQSRIAEMRQALDEARFAIEALLIANTREHGAIRLGDNVYRATVDRRRKLHNREAATAWAVDAGGADALLDIWRHDDGNVRWTALEAWIERYAASIVEPASDTDLTDTINLLADTLYRWEDGPRGGYQLSAAPVSKAKWSQQLEHGDRDPTRKPPPPPEPDPVENDGGGD